MPRIFISHKNADKPSVLPIVEQIEKSLGEKCWIDLNNIESDSQFADVICKAINKCEVFVFMHSKLVSDVTDFENDWTSREISYAESRKKRIVIVSIDGAKMNDHYQLLYGTKHIVDIRDSERYNKLIKDFNIWLGKQQTLKENIIKPVDNVCIGKETPTEDHINIADTKTPIAVLLGPPNVGKTMTLVRLARFLSEHGYSLKVDRSFRNYSDESYNRASSSFQTLTNNAEAAPATCANLSLLIAIYKDGKKIVQMIDMAGEHFYNQNNPNSAYSYIIDDIMSSPNLKIPIFLFEPYYGNNMESRVLYVNAIIGFCHMHLKKHSKCILLYNKIDKIKTSNVKNDDSLFTEFQEQYTNIMNIFSTNKLLTKLIKPYSAFFIPFVSGKYEMNNKQLYTPSNREYPLQLWETILSIAYGKKTKKIVEKTSRSIRWKGHRGIFTDPI